jgi:hypothetical protein
VSIIEHYTNADSVNPDWIRQMRLMEAACDFAPEVTAPQPVSVPVLEAA